MKLAHEEIKWLSGILKKMDFFSMCTLGEIEDFVSIASRKNYDRGSEIVKQGEEGSFFCVIYKGSVSVWAKEEGTGKRKLTVLGAGDYFGETALVEKQPRNATVVADKPCEVFLFYSGDFIDLLAKNPSLEKRFRRIADERSTERGQILSQPKKSFFKRLFGL